jgi:hypothetical protein
VQYAVFVRKVAIFAGIYVAAALALGLAYSWSWAAVVVVAGLIPAGATWFLVNRFGESYLEWGASEDRNRHVPH